MISAGHGGTMLPSSKRRRWGNGKKTGNNMMMPLGQGQRRTTGDIVKFMTRRKLRLSTWNVKPTTRQDEALVPFDEKYTIWNTTWNYLGVSCKGKINGVLMNTEMFLIGIVSAWIKLSMYLTNFSKFRWQTFKNSVQKSTRTPYFLDRFRAWLQKSRRSRLGDLTTYFSTTTNPLTIPGWRTEKPRSILRPSSTQKLR